MRKSFPDNDLIRSAKTRPYAPDSLLKKSRSMINKNTPIKKYLKSKESPAGKGGFGSVVIMKTRDKEKIAVKKIPHKSRREKDHNYYEIGFLSNCLHPNIVRYIDSFLVEDDIWIIMEYMEGGTLSEAAKAHTYTDKHIAYVAREVITAISFLHSLSYVHRDLKSSNVMMSIKGDIKLIDFGLCADFSEGPVVKILGSPFWIPPEMILDQPHSYPADIWSFGVSLLELYLRNPPYIESSLKCMFYTATEGLKGLIPDSATEDARDFLEKCLEFDQTERATAEQLIEHPWITRDGLKDGISEILHKVFLSHNLKTMGFLPV